MSSSGLSADLVLASVAVASDVCIRSIVLRMVSSNVAAGLTVLSVWVGGNLASLDSLAAEAEGWRATSPARMALSNSSGFTPSFSMRSVNSSNSLFMVVMSSSVAVDAAGLVFMFEMRDAISAFSFDMNNSSDSSVVGASGEPSGLPGPETEGADCWNCVAAEVDVENWSSTSRTVSAVTVVVNRVMNHRGHQDQDRSRPRQSLGPADLRGSGKMRAWKEILTWCPAQGMHIVAMHRKESAESSHGQRYKEFAPVMSPLAA